MIALLLNKPLDGWTGTIRADVATELRYLREAAQWAPRLQ